MLGKEDNEIVTRVGPGTPMGELMREYWIPAMMSVELPSPDCPPIRLRLLGENLIAFRATSGAVGVIQNACPHRGASLFFGRNEEEGLRCVYHGWKFDVTGQCTDMPSEPAESNFKTKIKALAYPTRERSGLVWVYMGPRQQPPELPSLIANMQPEGHYRIGAYLTECNWLQSLEGDFDTIHVGFLHRGSVRPEEIDRSNDPGLDYYAMKTHWAYWDVIDTEVGCTSGAHRPAEDDSEYWRIAQFLFPFYVMTPASFSTSSFICVVPIDDDHCIRWNVSETRPGAGIRLSDPIVNGIPSGWAYDAVNNASDWYGRFRPAGNQRNDYLIDREIQKGNRGGPGFSGMTSSRAQDGAVTESMGAIYQRDHEHLGVTDSGVIRMRRLLAKRAREFRDHGTPPPAVDNPELYKVRSLCTLLPVGTKGLEATKGEQWKNITSSPTAVGIRA